MSPEIRDQLLAEGGSEAVIPMRLIPDGDGFQLVLASVGGVFTESRNAPSTREGLAPTQQRETRAPD